MSRYIDADKLKKGLSIPSASIVEIGNAVIAQIDDIPTADVRENVNGEWIDAGEYPWDKCSICGYYANCYDEFNFCPNCGAQMMKGGDA